MYRGKKLKNRYFKKEFVICTDIDIDKLLFGGLPSYGRYFTKLCNKISDGVFKVEVKAPEGDLYYHFKYGKNFENVLLDSNNTQQGAKSWHSICRLGTENILPIGFDIDISYISKVSETFYEFKVLGFQEWINNISVLIFKNNVNKEIHLEKCYYCNGRSYYKAIIHKDYIENSKFCLKIYGKKNNYYFGKKRILSKTIDFYEFKILDQVKQCSKLQNNVIYHIFPDSFCRKEDDTNIKLKKWGDPPSKSGFFGGNINGIISKIEYLKELGIDCIYLTPVFKSESNHRYDCISFDEIDTILGNKYDFKKLIYLCHKNGIKVIMDIVLNHCGVNFFAFQDLLRNQEQSEFKEWFEVYEFPVYVEENNPPYSSWWGNGHMPQFNMKNENVRKFLIDTCMYWIKEFNIDGWRIDVSSELDIKFLKDLKLSIEKYSSKKIIIGENWKDSRLFLKENAVDGVTNYLIWWKAFEPFFIKETISISEFVNNIMYCYFLYSHNHMLKSWLIISSHDIPRFYYSMKNKENIYDVVFLQMLLPGSPVAYYGDEIGLEGKDDPDNRRCMCWEHDKENINILEWYKTLIKIRQKETCLKYGHLKILQVDDKNGLFIFARYFREQIYCIMNMYRKPISVNLSFIQNNKGLVNILNNEVITEKTVVVKNFMILKQLTRE